MDKNIKILGLSASVMLGILPAITHATCSSDIATCITIPSMSSFLSANGDWMAGIISLFSTPLWFWAGLMLAVGVVGFVVYLISMAVSHMHK